MKRMMNELRKQIQEELEKTTAFRKPSLRRCGDDRWLYETDLPRKAEDSETRSFVCRISVAGWHVKAEENRLLLDRESAYPPRDFYADSFGPEAARCLSILRRHDARNRGNDASQAVRQLIKAGEQGYAAYEQVCRTLHREWASDLREGKGVPDVQLSFFGEEGGKPQC